MGKKVCICSHSSCDFLQSDTFLSVNLCRVSTVYVSRGHWLFGKLWIHFLMSCFRGQRGLAESQKKELNQTPVLISCADQWTPAAATALRSRHMDVGSGALLSSVVTLCWRETWSGSSSHVVMNLLEHGVTVGGKRPSRPPPPCSSLSQCFLPKPSFGLRQDAFLKSSPPAPLAALLGPVEKSSCTPVHGFPFRDDCHGINVTLFCQVEAIFKVKSCNLKTAF